MVSSVLVELMGDAGEAPPSTKSGDESVNSVSAADCASRVCEVDIAGMEVEAGHVTSVPFVWLGTHV